jgi:hypothetical protein
MSNIFFTADGRKLNLERFGDVTPTQPSQPTQPVVQPPAVQSAKELEDSLRLKGNLSLDGTIRAGRFLMADGSEMKTVVNEQKVMALPETVSFDAQGNMTVGNKVNNNKLRLSNQWSEFASNEGAEISNDTKDYKTLMIVGNKSAGGTRSVGVWDKLTVHGQLCVSDKCVDKNSFGASSNTFSKGDGWGSVININAPVQPESLYSLNFGDGKNVHERQAGMGYVKGQPSVVGNARGTLATHIHQDDDWQLYSSGWNPLLSVKGGTGNTRVKGQLVVDGVAPLSEPNGQLRISNNGIMFGGPNNKDKEVNSAQISAGLHQANSLNIVGMSSAKGHQDRRVDMWAEGGFNVNGPINTGNKITATGGINNMVDNRNDDQPPSWYRRQGVGEYTEFKGNRNWAGLPPTFHYVKTIVPWGDNSGGAVKQIAYSDDGVRYRIGNDNNWTQWFWIGRMA